MTPEQIADVLDDAADYIEQHGWCQHRLVEEDGRVCAAGAIGAVMNTGCGVASTPAAIVGHALLVHVEGDATSAAEGQSPGVGTWNDWPGRTQADVLDAFRAAAKAQRSLP